MDASLIEEIGSIKVQQGRHDEQIQQTKSTLTKAWDAIDDIRVCMSDLKVSHAKMLVIVAFVQTVITGVVTAVIIKSLLPS